MYQLLPDGLRFSVSYTEISVDRLDFTACPCPLDEVFLFTCLKNTNWEIPPESRCGHRCKSMLHLVASLFEITLVAEYSLIVHPSVTLLFSVKPHALSKQTHGGWENVLVRYICFSQSSPNPQLTHTHTLSGLTGGASVTSKQVLFWGFAKRPQ